MTIWDLVSMAWRFWLVTLVGILLTVGGSLIVWQQQGVFNGQVNVVLLKPDVIPGNALANTSDSLISMAGVVAKMVGGPTGTSRAVSDQVTLVGEGAHEGYSVRQPNSGGQWEYRFETPVLDVQSAGRTEGAARAGMAAALASVQSAIDHLQSDASVRSNMRIRTQLSPTEPAFTYAHGSRTRALAATAVVGVLGTLGAVIAADRLSTRASRRLRARSSVAGA